MTDRPYILWPPDWTAMFEIDGGGTKATRAAKAYFRQADRADVCCVGMAHRQDVREWLAPIYAATGMPRCEVLTQFGYDGTQATYDKMLATDRVYLIANRPEIVVCDVEQHLSDPPSAKLDEDIRKLTSLQIDELWFFEAEHWGGRTYGDGPSPHAYPAPVVAGENQDYQIRCGKSLFNRDGKQMRATNGIVWMRPSTGEWLPRVDEFVDAVRIVRAFRPRRIGIWPGPADADDPTWTLLKAGADVWQ